MATSAPSTGGTPPRRKTPEHWNAMASLIAAGVSFLTFLFGFIGLPAAGVDSPAGTPATTTVTATQTVTATPRTSATTPDTPAASSPGVNEEDHAPALKASKLSIPPQSGVCNGNFMFVDLDEPRANSDDAGLVDGGPCIEGSHNFWLSNDLDITTSMASLSAAGCDKAIQTSPANSTFRLRNGLDWCQTTSEGDLALVHVVSTSDDGSLVIEVTTWSTPSQTR